MQCRKPRERFTLLMVLALLAAAPWAGAHAPAAAHGCTAPSRPADDQNEVLWQAYLGAVDDFRGCISDYATANQAAATVHTRAAHDAIEIWNQFVRDNLNVPKDFPWPPPEPAAPR